MKLKHLLILFGLLVISASLTYFGEPFDTITFFIGAILVIWLIIGLVKYLLK